MHNARFTLPEKVIVGGIAISVACGTFAVSAAALVPISGRLLIAGASPQGLHLLVLLGLVSLTIIGAWVGAHIGAKIVSANHLDIDESHT